MLCVSYQFLLDHTPEASRTLISRKFCTSCLSRQPCAAVDDTNMGGRHSNEQMFIEIFFVRSCNYLIISEKIFNWEMQRKWSFDDF